MPTITNNTKLQIITRINNCKKTTKNKSKSTQKTSESTKKHQNYQMITKSHWTVSQIPQKYPKTIHKRILHKEKKKISEKRHKDPNTTPKIIHKGKTQEDLPKRTPKDTTKYLSKTHRKHLKRRRHEQGVFWPPAKKIEKFWQRSSRKKQYCEHYVLIVWCGPQSTVPRDLLLLILSLFLLLLCLALKLKILIKISRDWDLSAVEGHTIM